MSVRAVFAALVVSLLVSGCDKPEPPKKEPPEVFVTAVEEQPYQPQRPFNARMESSDDVTISAQLSGVLLGIHFREGDRVKAGDLLFEIDPEPYEAALSGAKAELARASANFSVASSNFKRGDKLIADGYISASDYDTLKAKEQETQAAAKAAKAKVASAEVDLSRTRITAPIDGQIGQALPAVGDVVGPSYGTLTTIVGGHGMEAVFQVPERLLVAAHNSERQVGAEDIEVAITMPDGSTYPHLGRIESVSNRVNSSTGTFEVRAALDNPKNLLRPGMYVQAILRYKQPQVGLMIPQAALQVDQQGSFVFSVDDQNQVNRANVTTGDRYGENVLVLNGLEAGQRVVIKGIQKVRPGQAVKATLYDPSAPDGVSAQ